MQKRIITIGLLSVLLLGAVSPCTAAGRDTAKHGSGNRDTAAQARPMAFSGFFGGMMLHTGYMFSGDAVYILPQTGQTVHQRTQGVPVGLGGAAKFKFGRHLRIGGEGYVTRLTYGRHKSHATVGWGGALVEALWEFDKCRIFAGGVIGGGSQRNITLLEDTPPDFAAEDKISYRKYSFMALDPYLGAEIALSRKIYFVIKADYLFNVSNPQKDYMTGPRLFVGIMFGHSK